MSAVADKALVGPVAACATVLDTKVLLQSTAMSCIVTGSAFCTGIRLQDYYSSLLFFFVRKHFCILHPHLLLVI